MSTLLSLAMLLGIFLAIALFIAWIVFPFTVSRLLKSIDERLYHQNLHLVEIQRLMTIKSETQQFQPRIVYPPPLPPPLTPQASGIMLQSGVDVEAVRQFRVENDQ